MRGDATLPKKPTVTHTGGGRVRWKRSNSSVPPQAGQRGTLAVNGEAGVLDKPFRIFALERALHQVLPAFVGKAVEHSRRVRRNRRTVQTAEAARRADLKLTVFLQVLYHQSETQLASALHEGQPAAVGSQRGVEFGSSLVRMQRCGLFRLQIQLHGSQLNGTLQHEQLRNPRSHLSKLQPLRLAGQCRRRRLAQPPNHGQGPTGQSIRDPIKRTTRRHLKGIAALDRQLRSRSPIEQPTSEKWWGGDLNPRPAGYESATRFSEPTDNATSYVDEETSVAQQVATQSVDASCSGVMIPDDLSEVIRLWPQLPPEVKQAILTLVQSVVSSPTDS